TGLLAYLDAEHPGEGWADYLDGDQLRWSAIRLASHSTGGSHAVLIAQEHAVQRLCLMEAPVDVIGAPGDLRRLAPWIQAGGATPVDRVYGFRHVHTTSQVIPGFEGTWG